MKRFAFSGIIAAGLILAASADANAFEMLDRMMGWNGYGHGGGCSSCGCAAPSCGCQSSCDSCCAPKCRKHRCGGLFHKCHKRSCCAPTCCEPTCGCAAEPSCCAAAEPSCAAAAEPSCAAAAEPSCCAAEP